MIAGYLMIGIIILLLMYLVYDNCLLEKFYYTETILDKNVIKSYKYRKLMLVGKILCYVDAYMPTQYILTIKIDGIKHTFDLKEYSNLNVGDKINVIYTQKRISKIINIKRR